MISVPPSSLAATPELPSSASLASGAGGQPEAHAGLRPAWPWKQLSFEWPGVTNSWIGCKLWRSLLPKGAPHERPQLDLGRSRAPQIRDLGGGKHGRLSSSLRSAWWSLRRLLCVLATTTCLRSGSRQGPVKTPSGMLSWSRNCLSNCWLASPSIFTVLARLCTITDSWSLMFNGKCRPAGRGFVQPGTSFRAGNFWSRYSTGLLCLSRSCHVLSGIALGLDSMGGRDLDCFLRRLPTR